MPDGDVAWAAFRGEITQRVKQLERQIGELGSEKDREVSEVHRRIAAIDVTLSAMRTTLERVAEAVDKNEADKKREKDEYIAAIQAAASARKLSWSNMWPAILAGAVIVLLGGLLQAITSGGHP